MACIDRDYTLEALNQISEAIDDYMGGNDNVNFFEWLFPRGGAKEYKKFLRDMGNEKKEVKNKISNVLRKIAEEEKTYVNNFSDIDGEIKKMSNCLNKLATAISFKNFSIPMDFFSFALGNQSDIQEFMEAKAETIMEKPPDEWTDEEYEIVSYAFIYSTDENFKCRIINCFYSDSTNKHIIDNSSLFRKNTDATIRYYDRDNASWEKFSKLVEMYYSIEYKDYLSGVSNDGEASRSFENALGNYIIMKNFDSEEYSVLVSKRNNPIAYDEGEFQTYTAKYRKIEIEEDGTILADGVKILGGINRVDLMGAKTLYSIECVEKGEEAVDYISEKYKEDALETEDSWVPIVNIGSSIVTKGLDHLIPGTGKMISACESLINDAADREKKNTQYEFSYVQQFVNNFDVGVAFTSEGCILYNTPESIELLSQMLKVLKEDNYDMYNQYGGKNLTPESFVNGDIDVGDFMRSYLDWNS